jgi:hypothetical protein
LRYNYNMSSWKEGQKKRGGDFGYVCSELMPRCLQGNTLNAEYRLYSQGWRWNAKARLVRLQS